MNKMQYLLTKLAEEASEIAQIALKTQQFGIDEQCPGLDQTNIQRVDYEFNDLLAVVQLINSELGYTCLFENAGHIRRKQEKITKYMQYSIECGQVKLEE